MFPPRPRPLTLQPAGHRHAVEPHIAAQPKMRNRLPVRPARLLTDPRRWDAQPLSHVRGLEQPISHREPRECFCEKLGSGREASCSSRGGVTPGPARARL
jgi:hypothetical protein